MAAPTPQLVSAAPSPFASPFFSFLLKHAGKLRDIALAAGPVIYACGFLAVGIYASRLNLGLQSFPTSQLFVAGTGYVLIVGGVIVAIRVLLHLLRRWDNWLKSGTKAAKRTELALAGGTFGCFMFGAIARYLLHWHLAGTFAFYIGFGVLLASAVSLLRSYIVVAGAYLGLVAFFLYPITIYPILPQAMGGGAPRCAVIDIDSSKLSAKIYPVVFGHERGIETKAGTESSEVNVYFANDNIIIAQRKSANMDDLQMFGSRLTMHFPTALFELKKADVSAISWCK